MKSIMYNRVPTLRVLQLSNKEALELYEGPQGLRSLDGPSVLIPEVHEDLTPEQLDCLLGWGLFDKDGGYTAVQVAAIYVLRSLGEQRVLAANSRSYPHETELAYKIAQQYIAAFPWLRSVSAVIPRIASLEGKRWRGEQYYSLLRLFQSPSPLFWSHTDARMRRRAKLYDRLSPCRKQARYDYGYRPHHLDGEDALISSTCVGRFPWADACNAPEGLACPLRSDEPQ